MDIYTIMYIYVIIYKFQIKISNFTHKYTSRKHIVYIPIILQYNTQPTSLFDTNHRKSSILCINICLFMTDKYTNKYCL